MLDAQGPQYFIHGDCHAGNIYRMAEGTGLIDWQLLQRGGWRRHESFGLLGV
jgi:aminoglycoside phosphotransferase (APT) family kinase protein